MTHNDIIQAIEEFAPLDLQLEWDNSGKQVGDFNCQSSGVVLTLDITMNSLELAKASGANLIISHHPLIFGGVKSVTGDTEVQRIIIEAIKSNIAIYSAHTNVDCTVGGVSWTMARRLGLANVITLSENGCGCVGSLGKSMNSYDFVGFVKERYGLDFVKTNTNVPTDIRTVAVMGGSGASEIDAALRIGADAMVSGDFKYHDFQKVQDRLILIDIGHFESEIESMDIFLNVIQKKYPNFAIYILKQSFVQMV